MVEDFKTSLYLKKEEKDFLDRNSISLTKFVRNQMKPLLRKNENALSLEQDGESFMVIAPCLAETAIDPGVFHEIHVNLDLTHAAALRTAAFLHVEAKAPGLVATGTAFRELGKQLTDLVQDLDVCRWVGSRVPANGRLIDGNHFVDRIDSFDLAVGSDG